jgi:hypothetical protein
LAKSGLITARYVTTILGRYQGDGFTREVVRVQWRPDDPIELYVVLPHGSQKPPAILYLYDYRYDAERFRDDGWCKRATQNGFAAIGFTSAFSLERFHSRPLKEWFVSELPEALGASTHDTQMVLNYLGSRGDIDMQRVGMFGQGSGGAIALLTAAVDTRIAAVDVLNPWGDWPDWLRTSRQVPDDERALYNTPEFLARVRNLDPVQFLPSLGSRPVRLQQVMDDPVTPPEAKEKLAAAVRPPQQLARFEDGPAHGASWQKTGLSGWLRQQLGNRQSAASH